MQIKLSSKNFLAEHNLFMQMLMKLRYLSGVFLDWVEKIPKKKNMSRSSKF